MMNIKEEEDVNLGLGMGSTKFCIGTKLLTASGAGVNADSRVNLAFSASDPLSELVWSPNGLSLKCATLAAADKKPFLMWNVGRSSTQSFRLNRNGDGPVVDEGNLNVLDAYDMIIDKASEAELVECEGIIEEAGDKKDAVWEEENCMVDGDGKSCHPQNVKAEVIGNQISGGAEPSRENGLPGEGSPTGSRISLYQENGKEKALSDGDIIYRRSSDDSHQSAENCNSAGLSPKGIKRQTHDKDVILGSKRKKMQIHESHGSTSAMRPDSSFMNWISNMTKGLSDCNKEDSPSPLTLACYNDVYAKKCHEKFMCFSQQETGSISMGFQTIFQSLYCKEEVAVNNGGKKTAKSIEESREHTVDDKKSRENLAGSYDNSHVGSTRSANHESKKASEDTVSNRTKYGAIPPLHALDEEVKITAEKDIPSDVLVKGNPGVNLWISRLSSKTRRSEKGKGIAEETIGCSSSSCPKVDLGSQKNAIFLPIEQNSRGETADSKFNSSFKESQNFIIKSEASFEVKSISPILPSQRFSSEAMASVFAQRLDALRHITSAKSLACTRTCFFCGGCHDVHECPNITKSELEDLLLKLSAEESSYLCIRCSQSDHWAVSCPLAPSTDCSSRKPLLETFRAWKLEISATEKQPALESDPLCNIATFQNTDVKSQIFDAIRKLRVTRADILRWMNSDVPPSHLNGFFLRLRLGKVEAGVEGSSSYYVACITGDGSREKDIWRLDKSILVDVGGIKSYVATQYVSNHDFMEEEMEAWWCTSVDSGCGPPSLPHLNSKLNHRKTFGF